MKSLQCCTWLLLLIALSSASGDTDDTHTSTASSIAITVKPSSQNIQEDDSTSLIFSSDEIDNRELSPNDPTISTQTATDITEATDVASSLTPSQEAVFNELRDIWEYSLSLDDTTDKELKTTLSNVVQLAYARVQIEPDETLDRLKYLLEKLRQRIGVTTTSTLQSEVDQIELTTETSLDSVVQPTQETVEIASQHSQETSIGAAAHQTPKASTGSASILSLETSIGPRDNHSREIFGKNDGNQTLSHPSLLTRRRRSYGLGDGIGEVEAVPTSEENSIFSSYHHTPISHNNHLNSYYHYENPIPTVTPSEKTVQKVLVVQDRVTFSPMATVTNEKTTKFPFFMDKTTIVPPTKMTFPPTLFYPSLQASFSQYLTNKPWEHTEPTSTTTAAATAEEIVNKIQGSSNPSNPYIHSTKNPSNTYIHSTNNPSNTYTQNPKNPSNTYISSTHKPQDTSVEQIASEIVKLLYPPSNDIPVIVEHYPGNGGTKPQFTFPKDHYLFQEKLALLKNPHTATSTTKPELYPTYLQVHPLPTFPGMEINITSTTSLPPVLLNLIANLKNQSNFIGDYFHQANHTSDSDSLQADEFIASSSVTTGTNKISEPATTTVGTTTIDYSDVIVVESVVSPVQAPSTVAQIMEELQQSNLLQGPGAFLNGTRDGLVQFIATLSTLSFTTKMVMVFALSISVLSIVLGVYSLGPPIIAVGILGILIPIAILLLLQDTPKSKKSRIPQGKVTFFNDQVAAIIDLIDTAVDKFEQYSSS